MESFEERARLEEGEEVLATFRMAFDPTIFSWNVRDALLTTKRLIIDSGMLPESIDYDSIIRLAPMVQWDNDLIKIEREYCEPTIVGATSLNYVNPKRNLQLIKWLALICESEDREDAIRQIRKEIISSEDDRISGKGNRITYAFLAVIIFFLGLIVFGLWGGLAGAIIALSIMAKLITATPD